MTSDKPSGPLCPSCGSPPIPPPSSTQGIVGGVPTAGEMESTSRTHAERVKAGVAEARSGLKCFSCGETLYRSAERFLTHRIAPPVLPMSAAADRLRNHLRRLAITRLGRIDGDCYLLPFLRMEGTTPEGDETFTLLAASIGEERLERPFLPPADLKPFAPPDAGAAGSSGTGQAVLRVTWPTLPVPFLAARAEAAGWKVARPVELIHYPFWLMRVEDSGRLEGAWIDGIEGKLIHHRMRLAPPMPPRDARTIASAIPAAVAGALVVGLPVAEAALVAIAWGAGAFLIHSMTLRDWRG